MNVARTEAERVDGVTDDLDGAIDVGRGRRMPEREPQRTERTSPIEPLFPTNPTKSPSLG